MIRCVSVSVFVCVSVSVSVCVCLCACVCLWHVCVCVFVVSLCIHERLQGKQVLWFYKRKTLCVRSVVVYGMPLKYAVKHQKFHGRYNFHSCHKTVKTAKLCIYIIAEWNVIML